MKPFELSKEDKHLISILSDPSISTVIHIIHCKDFRSDMIAADIWELYTFQDKPVSIADLMFISEQIVFNLINALLECFRSSNFCHHFVIEVLNDSIFSLHFVN